MAWQKFFPWEKISWKFNIWKKSKSINLCQNFRRDKRKIKRPDWYSFKGPIRAVIMSPRHFRDLWFKTCFETFHSHRKISILAQTGLNNINFEHNYFWNLLIYLGKFDFPRSGMVTKGWERFKFVWDNWQLWVWIEFVRIWPNLGETRPVNPILPVKTYDQKSKFDP